MHGPYAPFARTSITYPLVIVSYLMRVYSATSAAIQHAILDIATERAGGALLDLGCGDGRLTLSLADRIGVTRRCGLEIDEEQAALARARGIDVVTGDLCTPWPWEAGTFDVVHANQVIEHVACTDHFLREMRRVLRPDGYAIVCTNNLASWHNVASLIVGAQPTPCQVSDEAVVGVPVSEWEGRRGSGHAHLRIFTGKALSALSEYHGLQTERALGVGYYPVPTRIARPLARWDPRHAAFLLHRLSPM
jgi:methionine biosynthesis protein MetW